MNNGSFAVSQVRSNFLTRCLVTIAVPVMMLSGCFGSSAEQYLAAAKVELGKHKNSAAIVQLKNALQKNPSLGEARYLLGQALLDTADARGATVELGKARELGYSEDKVVPALARAMLAQGQITRLLADFGQLRLSSPMDMADLQASLASAFASSGKTSLALDAVNSSLKADPANVRAQLIRVRLSAARTPNDSLMAIDQLIATAPKSSEAWQLKAELLSSNGKPDEAMKAYRKALTLDKDNVSARAGLLTLLLDKKDVDTASTELAALRSTKASVATVQMFTAMLALERNELKAAHESVQILLKVAPQDVRALFLAGAIEFRLGAMLPAERYLAQAVQAEPSLGKTRALLAQVYLRIGDSTKALEVLQPVLVDGATSIEALSIAAEAYLQDGDVKRAEEALIRAASLGPADPRSQVAVALINIGKGKVDQGVAELRAISASDPGSIADLALVNTFVQKRDVEQALKALETLEIKTPNQPGPRNLRGRIELGRGNKDKARQAFEAAVKIDPVYFPASVSLAQLDFEAKQPDAAAAHFRKILVLEPQSMAAKLAIVGLRAQAGAGKEELSAALSKLIEQAPSEVQPRLALIDLQLKNKDVKRAVTTAINAVAAFPESPDALKALAQAQTMSGDLNFAITTLSKLSSLQPKSPEPQLAIAQIYASLGDAANANQRIKHALSIKPRHQQAQLALISNELSRGNFTEARRLADAMKLQGPQNPLAYSISGDVDAVQKHWASAAVNYRTVLKLLPNPDTAIKLHRSLLAAGTADDAKRFEAEWLSDHPGHIQFLTYLADAALLEKKFELAQLHYSEVLKFQKENISANNNIAWLLNRVKDPRALQYAEKANALAPNQPNFLDTLAQIHADAGRYDQALKIQERVLALAPQSAVFRFHLAQFYIAAGKKAKARVELDQLAALGDKFDQQPAVKKLVESL